MVKDFSAVLKSYGLTSALGDNYGGEWPKAEFAKRGISYELCEYTKSELYLGMVPVVCSRRVELLDSEKLKNELRRLERRTARNGRESIDHPPKGSDDIANAVAGACWLALQGGMFQMPEAYGESICQSNYMDGLNEERNE